MKRRNAGRSRKDKCPISKILVVSSPSVLLRGPTLRQNFLRWIWAHLGCSTPCKGSLKTTSNQTDTQTNKQNKQTKNHQTAKKPNNPASRHPTNQTHQQSNIQTKPQQSKPCRNKSARKERNNKTSNLKQTDKQLKRDPRVKMTAASLFFFAQHAVVKARKAFSSDRWEKAKEAKLRILKMTAASKRKVPCQCEHTRHPVIQIKFGIDTKTLNHASKRTEEDQSENDKLRLSGKRICSPTLLSIKIKNKSVFVHLFQSAALEIWKKTPV